MHLTQNWGLGYPQVLKPGPRHVKFVALQSNHQFKMWQYKQSSAKDLGSLARFRPIFKSWQYFPLTLIRFFIFNWKFVQACGYLESQGPSAVHCNTSQTLLALLPFHSNAAMKTIFCFPCFDDNGFVFATSDSKMPEGFQGPSEQSLSLPIISYLLLSYWS